MTERKMRLLALVSVMGLFGGGFTVGYFTRTLLDSRTMRPAPPPPPQVVQKYATELGLSSQQQAQIQTILESGKTRAHAIFRGNRPQLEAIREDMEKRIEAVLTDEQRIKYRALREQPGGPANGQRLGPGGLHPPGHDPTHGQGRPVHPPPHLH